MRPHSFLVTLLALAGCAHSPQRTPRDPAPLHTSTDTCVTAVPLQPVVLASLSPASSTLLPVDAWLDDYFATCRVFEEKEFRAALATHPEWAPQIEAKRQVSLENENVARAAFIYLSRTGTSRIFWSDGNWIWNVLPCNCGKIHHIEAPGWADRFQQLTKARVALEEIANEDFSNAYLLAVFDLKASLKPEWKTQMERLKPGFLRFMREPVSSAVSP